MDVDFDWLLGLRFERPFPTTFPTTSA